MGGIAYELTSFFYKHETKIQSKNILLAFNCYVIVNIPQKTVIMKKVSKLQNKIIFRLRLFD